FISIRYLLSHMRQSVVCVAGVTISVTMFIVMTAMMRGFTDKFIIETGESSGHIVVHDEPRETRTKILEKAYKDPNALLALGGVKPREVVKKIKNPIGLIATIRRMPGILAASPQVSGDAIATFGTKTLHLNMYGVEPEPTMAVTTIGSKVIEGDFGRLKTAGDGIVIGKGVADLLGAQIDDNISLA